MTLKTLLAGASLAFALGAPALAQDAHADGETRVVVVQDGGPGSGEMHKQCRIIVEDHHGGGDAHMGGGGHMVMMMDGAKGPITREQFLAEQAKMFDEMDANHDGKLEPDEIKAFHEKHMAMAGGDAAGCHEAMTQHMGAMHEGAGMSFEALDANHDGRVTFEEFSVHFRKLFDMLDKDHKGYLTKEDWPNHIEIMMRHEHHGEEK
jgi:hypothetical protein